MKDRCPFIDQCGYAAWRSSGVNLLALPLENGGCEIPTQKCARLSNIDVLSKFGPQTTTEIETAFPLRFPDPHPTNKVRLRRLP